ncbi:hypothetical protein BEL04_08610 [Mucilaginibacter sp. PPCGB 2223]|uniref:hypothetical protein n=1 Tax=Mucilaginibacter sp. PPCGB 2223 TaxID=1886027 RepID=UPI00082599F2|nr:hypothetical protein [Mucilaginibacter sp. PPCGB 2223]OCX54310.1 hypothetical protein BEL04_08610 [Mucilaginibacter sp. PPCGB 2223]
MVYALHLASKEALFPDKLVDRLTVEGKIKLQFDFFEVVFVGQVAGDNIVFDGLVAVQALLAVLVEPGFFAVDVIAADFAG